MSELPGISYDDTTIRDESADDTGIRRSLWLSIVIHYLRFEVWFEKIWFGKNNGLYYFGLYIGVD